jgi:hypothetical protein
MRRSEARYHTTAVVPKPEPGLNPEPELELGPEPGPKAALVANRAASRPAPAPALFMSGAVVVWCDVPGE